MRDRTEAETTTEARSITENGLLQAAGEIEQRDDSCRIS